MTRLPALYATREALFKAGSLRGHPLPPRREALRGWLEAGFDDPTIGPQAGFVAFGGRKSAC